MGEDTKQPPNPTTLDKLIALDTSDPRKALTEIAKLADSIQPGPSENYVLNYNNKQIELQASDVENIHKYVRENFKQAIAQIRGKVGGARHLYETQEKANKESRTASFWTHVLGGIDNPDEFVAENVRKANGFSYIADTNLDKGKFADAAYMLIQSGDAADKLDIVVKAYREEIAGTAGDIVSSLEFIRDTSFKVNAGLATIATGGTSAGLAGFISVAAPTATKLAQQGMEVHYGLRDNIAWGSLAVETLVDVVTQHMSGALGGKLYGHLVGTGAASLGRQALASFTTSLITGRGEELFKTSAQTVYKLAKGKDITFDQYLDELAEDLVTKEAFVEMAMDAGMGELGHRMQQRARAKSERSAEQSTPPPATQPHETTGGPKTQQPAATDKVPERVPTAGSLDGRGGSGKGGPINQQAAATDKVPEHSPTAGLVNEKSGGGKSGSKKQQAAATESPEHPSTTEQRQKPSKKTGAAEKQETGAKPTEPSVQKKAHQPASTSEPSDAKGKPKAQPTAAEPLDREGAKQVGQKPPEVGGGEGSKGTKSRFMGTSQGDIIPIPNKPSGARQKELVGGSRELLIAEITGGRVAKKMNKKGEKVNIVDLEIKAPKGTPTRVPVKGERYDELIYAKEKGVPIDVIGPNGELIAVGGPAKGGKNLEKTGGALKRLKELADRYGVKAQAYFEQGTGPDVINRAIKELGDGNVHIFTKGGKIVPNEQGSLGNAVKPERDVTATDLKDGSGSQELQLAKQGSNVEQTADQQGVLNDGSGGQELRLGRQQSNVKQMADQQGVRKDGSGGQELRLGKQKSKAEQKTDQQGVLKDGSGSQELRLGKQKSKAEQKIDQQGVHNDSSGSQELRLGKQQSNVEQMPNQQGVIKDVQAKEVQAKEVQAKEVQAKEVQAKEVQAKDVPSA